LPYADLRRPPALRARLEQDFLPAGFRLPLPGHLLLRASELPLLGAALPAPEAGTAARRLASCAGARAGREPGAASAAPPPPPVAWAPGPGLIRLAKLSLGERQCLFVPGRKTRRK